jgi:hypothetical protein
MRLDSGYQRLLARRAPIEDRAFEKFAEPFESEPRRATRYLLGAMQPVDDRYTGRLIEQGNRVENQLRRRLLDSYPSADYRRQGSVSNDTHIRYASDVDVLVLTDKFVTLQAPQIVTVPYRGDPLDDLRALRSICERSLRDAFPKVDIDSTCSTAIKLKKSASLTSNVDVVPANWFDTVEYAQHRLEMDRWIQILNCQTNSRQLNAPFLFNALLDARDNETGGEVRALIRLMKNVKADLEDEGADVGSISSFDICSIIYRFHKRSVFGRANVPGFVGQAITWMAAVAANSSLRQGVRVIDQSREIFNEANKVNAFAQLVRGLSAVHAEALSEHRLPGMLLAGP